MEIRWEKAARGTNGLIYPWGNQFDCNNSCNLVSPCNDKPLSTCSVGSYPQDKSPYGVMDMGGNVKNWVRDWYDSNYYVHSPVHNPQGADNGSDRVIRGGAWIFNYQTLLTFPHFIEHLELEFPDQSLPLSDTVLQILPV